MMRFVSLPLNGEQDLDLTASQVVEVWTKAFHAGWTKEQVRRLMKDVFGVERLGLLRQSQLQKALQYVERTPIEAITRTGAQAQDE